MSGDPESSVIDSSAHLDNGRNISARQAITNLIGTKVTCTMLDGRKIVGSLVCVDRLYVFVFCVVAVLFFKSGRG